jgi:hypothetical protein
MATLLGATNGVFGIANAQTGFLLDSTSWAYSDDVKMVKNISGDDTGEAHYNERVEIQLSGFLPASSAFSGTLASSITLATVPTDHLIGSITAGLTIIQTITRNNRSEDYQRIELTAKYSPTIVSA